jgi:hypothetical protein
MNFVLDAAPAMKLLGDVRARAEDPSPWARTVPEIVRRGPGSFGEQIDRRQHYQLAGGTLPWREPAYAKGRPDPDEDILLDAIEGRSPASFTVVDRFGARLGVRDVMLRILYAARGNGIVSTAPLASFLTGDFGRRTAPALAKPVKAIRRTGRPRGIRSAAAKAVARNITKWSRGFAMYFRLLYSFGYDATEAELRAGISVPPKGIGPNPIMERRLRDGLIEYVIGKARLARGAALDPRRVA